MFTFSVTDIRVVMMRGRLDAYVYGGFRNPHYGLYPGRDEKPGIWLVGDEGVYIMSNGKLAEGTRALVIYAEQCHPKGDIDWWDYKRRHFGADDGIEFIEAERLIPLFDRSMGATHLNVQLTESEIALSLITR